MEGEQVPAQAIPLPLPPQMAGQVQPQYRSPKIRTYSGVDPNSWLRWKNHVIISIRGYQRAGWAAEAIKDEILRNLDGAAADSLGETPMGGDEITPLLFLERLEARLLPAAAHDQAVSEYENATQAADQTLQAYHVHLEKLYRRAFPQAEDWNTSRLLITKFTSTLRNQALKQALVSMTINDYQHARAQASLAEAGLARLNKRNPAASLNAIVPPEMVSGLSDVKVDLDNPDVAKTINFMGKWYSSRGRSSRPRRRGSPTGRRSPPTSQEQPVCYACGGTDGHFIRDCVHREAYNRGKRAGEKRAAAGGGSRDSKRPSNTGGNHYTSGRGRGSGSGGRGGRGRPSARDRLGPKPSVNQLGDPEEYGYDPDQGGQNEGGDDYGLAKNE